MYDITGKVALVTGGAAGIGLSCSKELLRNGAKGVTLADCNAEAGKTALVEIEKEFGANKAIFVHTDVTKNEEFENAYEKTIEKFKNVDILFNNAGIFNDKNYEREIEINLTGTVRGCVLAIEKYLPKHKQGPEALVVNTASILSTNHGEGSAPVYTATKHAVFGLTKSWGFPGLYDVTKVRVVAICPGMTLTSLVDNVEQSALGEKYVAVLEKMIPTYATQGPEFVGKEAVEVAKYAPTGTAWVIEGNEPAYQYETPDRSTMKKNVLKKN